MRIAAIIVNIMNIRLKTFSLVCLIVLLNCFANYAATMKTPDFAFPKQVSTQSLATLKQAVAAGNGPGTVRAILDHSLAQSAIGNDKIPESLSLIDKTVSQLKKPEAKAMLWLVKATILDAVYDNDKYTYNQRNLPLLPLPEDYTEWNGEQFRYVISQLCDSVMAQSNLLKTVSIKEYYTSITHDNQTAVYFPTLFDFAAYRTIYLRSGLTQFGNMLSLAFLSPSRIFIAEPLFVPMSQEATKILDTYAELLKFHESQPAPYIYADLERLDFVDDNLYSIGDYETTRQKYREALQNLYDTHSSSEYSGDVLLGITRANLQNPDSFETWLYNAAKHNIKQFPAYARINNLKNLLTDLSRKNLNITHPTTIYPQKEFSVNVRNKNTERYSLSLYQLPPAFTSKNHYKGSITNLKLIAQKEVVATEEIPFDKNDTIHFTAPEIGNYIIVATSKELDKKDNDYYIISCSKLAAGSFTLGQNTLFVIDPMSGEPVKDVAIKQLNKNVLIPLGHTDENGFYNISKDLPGSTPMYAQKGEDVYSSPINIYKPYNRTAVTDTVVSAFTELPLYHLGDSVKFAAIAYSVVGENHHTIANTTICAHLFDANRQLVDTLALTTDEFGRANGHFKLPTDGLTGTFSITFNSGRKETKRFSRNTNGQIEFTVSDYKLPTFEVTADKALTDFPDKGDVTLRGTVKTFSGVPLANQNVTLNLSVAIRSGWITSNEVQFYTDSVTTDNNGNWELVLTKDLLDYSPAADGYFRAIISSTTPSGESQQTSVSFTRTAKYHINVPDFSQIDITKPVKLNAKVFNSADEPVSMQMNYRLIHNGTVIASGIVKPEMDWSNIPIDEYELKIYLEQDSTVDTNGTTLLYSPTGKISPSKDPVWIPGEQHPSIIEKDNVEVLYGVRNDNTYILYILSTPEKILEQKWIKADRGMHNLKVALPTGIDKADLKLSASYDMQSSLCSKTIKRQSLLKSLNLKVESFRDKMVPGATETWKFTTENINGKGEQSAIILSMYNAALSSIQSPTWMFRPYSGYTQSLYLHEPSIKGTSYSTIYQDIKYLPASNFISPVFNLYDQSFVQRVQFLYKTALTSAMMSRASGADNIIEEKAEASTEEDAGGLLDSASPTAANSNSQQEFAYRDGNQVSGLWMPALTTEPDGNISISFTVPNANTTWQLFATAFNKELTNTTFAKQVLANKPIMVQPNLPRYLRTGDRAVLKSLVFNNSDSTQNITTVMELFNPLTQEVTQTSGQTLVVQPGENATVAVEITAPTDLPMLGFRVKSSTELYADGEQSLLPILPASQPVIETTPFYIAPDSTDFRLTLPKMPADARVTLQYCDNPLWYVVTALPGLAEQQPATAINAAYNIFSAAVARGILNDNPTIVEALEYWTSSNGSDSTLVSMLERNADLKTVWLNATPWLADAKSDTERMTRLALLLDKSNINSTIDSGIDYLNKVNRNGGLAWTSQCTEPSLWATSEVLACLGRVNELGYLPDSKKLRTIIDNALAYMQKENEKLYSKYPKANYFSYVATLDLWPSFKRSAVSTTITSATVQKVVNNWRSYSIAAKAESVLMLMKHNYKNVAATILASMREYAESTPQQGMWWPSVGDIYGGSMAQLQVAADALEAFHAAEPTSADIDRIRQWLILQKEAENWGSSASTSDVISSILLTSKSWIQPSAPAVLKLNGQPIATPGADRYTGYLRTSISPLSPSEATLSIERQGTTPAFGALFCQYTQDMADIKAQSCEAVSIEKRILLHNGTSTEVADTLTVGNKVQVTLTIHVNRDLEYVAITDNRPACFEPVEQLPAPIYSDGVCFYRENRDSATNIFVTNMPKGTYQLTYDMWVNNAGQFASGIATLQSQYAPQLTAHSSGTILNVNP